MSTKTWGFDIRTNRLVNIRDITKADRDYIKCTSPTCVCNLIPNMGKKKDFYFRHPSGVKCNGASAESIIHDVCKEILYELDSISLPASYFFYNGFAREIDNSVNVSNIIPLDEFEDIKPDICFKLEDGSYCCININLSKISLNKYKKLLSEYNLRVYNIDMSGFKCDIDNLSRDDLRSELLSHCKLELSNKLNNLNKKCQKGIYKQFIGNIICPVSEEKINTKKCSSCCFHIQTRDGVMTCGGNGCYRSIIDLLSDTTRDERKDMYYELVPRSKKVEKILDLDERVEHPFGVCICGKPFILARGDLSQHIRGIKVFNQMNEQFMDFRESAYLYCPHCNNTVPLLCRTCGSPLKVWRNSNNAYKSCGSVFIGCSNRKVLPEGYCNSDTLTLFTDTSCNEYADELKAVMTLENWLSKNRRAMINLARVRGKYKGGN